MLLDSRLEFADALAVSGVATTIAIIPNSNVIDLGTLLGGSAGATDIGRYVGLGEDLVLVVNTDTSIITGGGAGTYAVALYSNATADLASTPTLHFQTKAFVTGATSDAEITAGGTLAMIKLPAGKYQRYLVLGHIIGSTTTTAGKINAFITKDAIKTVAYPNAVNG